MEGPIDSHGFSKLSPFRVCSTLSLLIVFSFTIVHTTQDLRNTVPANCVFLRNTVLQF